MAAIDQCTKGARDLDQRIGERIRQRRVALKMSQEKLGKALGVSFQQVQKYERGANRIAASRLQQIADVLGIPVGALYDPPDSKPGLNGHLFNPTAHDILDLTSHMSGPQQRLIRDIARLVAQAEQRSP